MSDTNRPTGYELFKCAGCWHIRYIDAEGRRQHQPTRVPLNHPKRATRAMKNLEARHLKALSFGPSVETPEEPAISGPASARSLAVSDRVADEDGGGTPRSDAVRELRAIGGDLMLRDAFREGQVSMMSPWMSMKEAAVYLKYHSKHAPTIVRIMMQRAHVPLYRRNGKTFLARRVDIDEWIETGDCVMGRRYQVERARASAKAKAAGMPPLIAPDASIPTAPGEKRGRGRPRKLLPPVEPDR